MSLLLVPEKFSWVAGQYRTLKIICIYKIGRKRNKRVKEKHATKEQKTLTVNHLFKSSLNKGLKLRIIGKNFKYYTLESVKVFQTGKNP